ncbi:protein adenylyltransferase SelO [Celeribacter sp.]|uniref:protein adenylyltransferase SelO n=1 Tax=Celeribacter sp. TaxID=1890673 RepID=UPI003A944E78
MIRFDNSYARLPDRMFARIAPEEVPAPEMVLHNDTLAEALGVTDWGADVFAGNTIPDGADPIAQAYAGHQFGGWVPQLGDGRAVLLGEIVGPEGRVDIQLKGAGRTPFSRRGDGRAWIGPALREYLVSEFMYAAGVPTTRALAVVRTGERVQRERGYPGAILTRVAASHIRVGTFQYFTARDDTEALEALEAQVRDRHYPDAKTARDLYAAIVGAQAELVAKWMGLGFVHGVMNTDNMAVSGETIDYGPCAFLDRYDPKACFSSIDQYGRYAYDQQANMAGWNLAQLGSCFVPLVARDLAADGMAAAETTEAAVAALTEVLTDFPTRYQDAWRNTFAAKIGIAAPREGDEELVQDLLTLMAAGEVDFTNFFRGLSDGTARDMLPDPTAFDAWEGRWQARLAEEADDHDPQALMAATNPVIIPRNHQIERVIAAAVEGDDAPARALETALRTPFDTAHAGGNLATPPQSHERVTQTFCGT